MEPITHSQLVNELHATAEALSRQRVRLSLENDIKAYYRYMAQTLGAEPPPDLHGFCVTTRQGVFIIALSIHLSISQLYGTFLHETAHAYLSGLGMILPDREEAAREVAGIWAVSIERRAARDIQELMQWLERLKGYHETNRNDYTFTMGANRGMFLPMATRIPFIRIIAGSNRVSRGG